jgi:hypothetical protein
MAREAQNAFRAIWFFVFHLGKVCFILDTKEELD